VVCREEKRKAYRFFDIIHPEEKKPLRTPISRCRKENDTKIYLEYMRWDYVDWIHIEKMDQWRISMDVLVDVRIP
jgi:hypothetical protein